eukprot:GILI01005379.1.p1 GENE.GILI01005379.1~~GILI01005379.1.p1  ORF type:complete len:524 (-),score=74.53 GILI01005379.1:304-1875(-)
MQHEAPFIPAGATPCAVRVLKKSGSPYKVTDSSLATSFLIENPRLCTFSVSDKKKVDGKRKPPKHRSPSPQSPSSPSLSHSQSVPEFGSSFFGSKPASSPNNRSIYDSPTASSIDALSSSFFSSPSSPAAKKSGPAFRSILLSGLPTLSTSLSSPVLNSSASMGALHRPSISTLPNSSSVSLPSPLRPNSSPAQSLPKLKLPSDRPPTSGVSSVMSVKARARFSKKPKTPRQFPSGSFSILYSKSGPAQIAQTQLKTGHGSSKVSQENRIKLKWKSIQWLCSDKKLKLRNIRSSMKEISKYFNQEGGMDRPAFAQCMAYLGIGDPQVVEKLFWLFDDDGNGTVDYKELMVGLEFFQDNSMEEKLDTFFNLCDEDGSGTLEEGELYEVLKLNAINAEERRAIKAAVTSIFAKRRLKGITAGITKDEFFSATKSNGDLLYLVEKNARRAQNVDQWIEEDLQKPLIKGSFMGGSRNEKPRGIYHPFFDRFVEAMHEGERIYPLAQGAKAIGEHILSKYVEEDEDYS